MDDVPHLDASGNIAKMVLMMPDTTGTSSLFIDEEFFIGNVRDLSHPIEGDAEERRDLVGHKESGVHRVR